MSRPRRKVIELQVVTDVPNAELRQAKAATLTDEAGIPICSLGVEQIQVNAVSAALPDRSKKKRPGRAGKKGVRK